MNITIEAPAGPRTGVIPFERIDDEVGLLKSLALTLAVERGLGVEDVILRINVSNAAPERLIAMARIFSQMQTDAKAPSLIGRCAQSHVRAQSIKVLAEDRRARQLLGALEAHIEAGHGPLHGYKAAAELINWNTAICLPVGQICSRLDLAAFNAELPMLALNWVRKPDGSINRKAFAPQWADFEDKFVEQMVTHRWKREHFSLLRDHLERLPRDVCAVKLWEQCEAKWRHATSFVVR